jgi:hypothetical protein
VERRRPRCPHPEASQDRIREAAVRNKSRLSGRLLFDGTFFGAGFGFYASGGLVDNVAGFYACLCLHGFLLSLATWLACCLLSSVAWAVTRCVDRLLHSSWFSWLLLSLSSVSLLCSASCWPNPRHFFRLAKVIENNRVTAWLAAEGMAWRGFANWMVSETLAHRLAKLRWHARDGQTSKGRLCRP